MGKKAVGLSLVVDFLMITIAVFTALMFHWELVPISFSNSVILYIVISVLGLFAGVYFFGVYSRIWQYAGISDFLYIIAAVSWGTVFVLITAYAFLPDYFLSSVPVLWLMAVLLLGGARFIYRLKWHYSSKNRHDRKNKKVLVIGAGEAGALIVRTLQSSKTAVGVETVGFIDDDTDKKGFKLYGVPVLGTREDIPEIVQAFHVDEAIIAIPTLDAKEIKVIADICRRAGVQVKVLPSVLDLIQGKSLLGRVRELRMEDLLHRNEVERDLQQIAGYLKDQVVLVTGAGGSIGSELCRQICSFLPRELILLGRGENSIYEIMSELSGIQSGVRLVPVIADIKDAETMAEIFAKYKPNVVFHAAAHKHVDLMEHHPDEAFRNNVFGTLNLARIADRYHTNTFVLISTDKAVNPSSIMGLTKLLAEMIIRHYARISKTKFAAVRFGNVLGSRGSVVHLFRRQIASGGPVTVTHPEMRRYFMTIKEAVQLVIQAGGMAKGGEVFVLDMGEQVRIVDLAREMILLSGLCPDKDIEIKIVGMRPGEKLSEELLTAQEKMLATAHQKIFVVENSLIDEELVSLILSLEGSPSLTEIKKLRRLAQAKYHLNTNLPNRYPLERESSKTCLRGQ